MPTLDWLNRVAARVPYEIEKRQICELWARKSRGRCFFGQIAMQRDGIGMSGQLDALLA